ncbi:MAG: hypothetical protein J1F28_06680 [Oscillospiraceae bacterium]|nr:hypothetical protein [Oscillospiraceae bacterium]
MSKISYIEHERPVLSADLRGTEGHESVAGEVSVHKLENGLCLCASFTGLPASQYLPFHIHEGTSCENAGGHLLELPDIMSDRNGEAYAHYYFDRQNLSEISEHSIMLHVRKNGEEPAIACGVLKKVL